jgi:hypothetical protein
MVTKDVPAALINAFHYSVQDYNSAQSEVKVLMKFFIGNTSHPLLDERLAVESTAVETESEDTLSRHRFLPQFVKGEFPENMNDGKTREWFRWAASVFPYSQWILKVDTDVTINWHDLGTILSDTKREMRYLGIINDSARCGGGDLCPPVGCMSQEGSCWIYMSGGFYGVSTQLAQVLGGCSYYQQHDKGHEDVRFGQAVKHCIHNTSALWIVNVPVGQAWCHSKATTTTHVRLGQMPPGGCM